MENLDKQLEEIEVYKPFKPIGFLPWYGKDYFKLQPKNKILILGESVYGDDWPQKETSTNLIETYAMGEKKNGLFGNISRAICGKNPDSAEVFWNKVAFNNFVQVPMEKLGDRPSARDYWNKFHN